MKSIKSIWHDMIDKSILYIKGDEGKESFYVYNGEKSDNITESLNMTENCAIKRVIN